MLPLYDFKHPRPHPSRGDREPHDKIHKRTRAPWTPDQQPKEWWSLSGSNRRPEACKATALPAELRPPWRSQGLNLASIAGGNVRSLGCPAHQRGRPVGLATLTRRSRTPPSGKGRMAAADVSAESQADGGPRRRLRQTNNGGPGTTRTSDLTLIRGAL